MFPLNSPQSTSVYLFNTQVWFDVSFGVLAISDRCPAVIKAERLNQR